MWRKSWRKLQSVQASLCNVWNEQENDDKDKNFPVAVEEYKNLGIHTFPATSAIMHHMYTLSVNRQQCLAQGHGIKFCAWEHADGVFESTEVVHFVEKCGPCRIHDLHVFWIAPCGWLVDGKFEKYITPKKVVGFRVHEQIRNAHAHGSIFCFAKIQVSRICLAYCVCRGDAFRVHVGVKATISVQYKVSNRVDALDGMWVRHVHVQVFWENALDKLGTCLGIPNDMTPCRILVCPRFPMVLKLCVQLFAVYWERKPYLVYDFTVLCKQKRVKLVKNCMFCRERHFNFGKHSIRFVFDDVQTLEKENCPKMCFLRNVNGNICKFLETD